jgi:hypothetical protein
MLYSTTCLNRLLGHGLERCQSSDLPRDLLLAALLLPVYKFLEVERLPAGFEQK